MRFLAYLYLSASILVACEAPRQKNGENQLASGIRFKVLKRDDKGQKVNTGDYVLMHFISKVGKDTLDNTYKQLGEAQTLLVRPETGLPSEVLPYLQVGDSVVVTTSMDSLVKKTGNPVFAELKEKGQTMDYYVKVVGVKSKEQVQKEAMEREKKAQEEAKKAESEEGGKIDAFVAKSATPYEKTASGLYYFMTVKKPEAQQAKKGDSVLVHYTGKLLDGKVFDSSVNRGEPFQFVLGIGSVIPGWDEGIAMLRKGEKATLLIPSKLGYGARGAGNGVIPPFAPLLFEVELLDIKSKK
jgi:FKBP-type peptidyl-prolyl cis-trans isomerase